MKKTIDILEHIQSYCEDVECSLERFGRDKEIFDTDRDYRNSVCMSLLQIGELTGHLPEEFRESTKGTVYWPAIKGMRNIFAHNYGAVDIDMVWETAVTDVPLLRAFCDKVICDYHSSEEENRDGV